MNRRKMFRKMSAAIAAVMITASLNIPVLAAEITVDTEGNPEEIIVETDDNIPETGYNDPVDEATNYTFVIKDGTAEITGYSLIGSSSDNLGDLNIPGTVKLELKFFRTHA